jgi:hypothetical protein
MALRNSMRIRGLVKLISLIIVCNQVLTAAFSYACRTIDPTVTPVVISGFGLISSLMISYWLQSDARRAYHHASEKKLVKGRSMSKKMAGDAAHRTQPDARGPIAPGEPVVRYVSAGEFL